VAAVPADVCASRRSLEGDVEGPDVRGSSDLKAEIEGEMPARRAAVSKSEVVSMRRRSKASPAGECDPLLTPLRTRLPRGLVNLCRTMCFSGLGGNSKRRNEGRFELSEFVCGWDATIGLHSPVVEGFVGTSVLR